MTGSRAFSVAMLTSTLLAAGSAGAVTIQNFDGGMPAGWIAAGNAWTVGGPTGSSPNILPPQGSGFARSGAPNAGGSLGETLTGSFTSPALTVSHEAIQWLAAGWSGQQGNGLNRFEVLNASMSVVATVAAPLSDSWLPRSVNLLASGLAPGDTFYFRAVDGSSASGYSWLALDALEFTGAPVPEPATALLMLTGLGLLLGRRRG